MTLNELYENVYSTEETKYPDEFIRIYEQNSALIENQDINADKELYSKVTRLIGDYANNLTLKEAYSKALPYLIRAIELFENFDDFDKSKMNDVEFYRVLRFDRAIAYYYLKEFKKSEQDFEWLKEHNPDNDKYKNWLLSIRYRKHDSILKILWYIIPAAIILNSIIDRNNYQLVHITIVTIGALAIIIASALELRKYINKRKLKGV